METWKPSFDDWRLLVEPFKNFDRIFTGTANCVETLANATGVPCDYLPPAVDALKFCPYPEPRQRTIDVCCVGRRFPHVHQVLFQRFQQDRNFFYFYDTIKNQKLEIDDGRQHRAKLISLLQRTRYNITAHAKFNSVEETGGSQEIGSRYFEGVAAGTVMLGMPPRGEAFQRYFDWEDALVEVDFQHQDVLDVIEELDAQPERVANIRHCNVVNTLLKHDWVYRWRTILTALGLEPSPAVLDREQYLRTLAHSIESFKDTSNNYLTSSFKRLKPLNISGECQQNADK
ncbi:glycosyltransferase [Leptothoe sp. PORK10 BA2]|uniref:glycosyltransferase n=1 Tax=Leptothoe sp. PORK10 BA2 TaxID=3110254 RepID=UPI002B20A7B9|nr:glycosyltransferase [Leptothoe sp. PORK10 BA2]MEA5462369.1 glycosyltransferase [Leptothoe sp. PORK10 BA2]